MNRKHLLWWIFKHLEERHPKVLKELLNLRGGFGGEATHTVTEVMQERFAAYKKGAE